jgi:adenosylmethionine-8-amino-7-oxononanoate aminotransferase
MAEGNEGRRDISGRCGWSLLRVAEAFPNILDPHHVVAAAFEKGLIARALFQCVALSPPLVATKADIDRMVGILQSLWGRAEKEILSQAA